MPRWGKGRPVRADSTSVRCFTRSVVPTLVVVFAMVAGACSVDPAGVELTMMVEAPTGTDESAGDVAGNDAVVVETNDAGEELLPRVITGSFEPDECDVIDVSLLPIEPECGRLIRPLHGSSTFDIELPVLVFRSTAPDPAPDPVIYLHGGPTDGILSILEYPEVYDSIVGEFVGERDVIVFDQRGTGLAEPDLKCDHPAIWFNAYDEDPETFVPRTAGSCALELRSSGIRQDQFSRQSSADDVMVLARELGYEQVNLHGSSWGGILAYTVMQLHPTWVRAAVLDSPLSIDTDLTGSMPGSFQEAMEGLQANCDAVASCRQRYGNIVDRYIRVSDQLDESPLTIYYEGRFPLEVNADELSYLLFGMFYSPAEIAMIPDLLVDLENGDTRLVEELVHELGWGWGIDFTFLTYMCTDMVPASSPERVEAQQIGIPAFDRVDDAPDGRGHTAQAICERMQVRPPAKPALRETVPTTPTIVLSGRMDPITPFSSGQAIANGIPNGYFVGFDDLSHGVTHTRCGLDIAIAFLDDPTTEPDLTCSLPSNRPPFEFARVGFTTP